MTTVRTFIVALVFVAVCGCGQQAAPGPEDPLAGSLAAAPGDAVAQNQPPVPDANTASARESRGAGRKIVFTANLSLAVEDFADVQSRIDALVGRNGGYIAHAELQGPVGGPRHGRWTVRVPVENYRDFVNAVAGVGELRSRNEFSREVTAEYVDLQARIVNKQREEARLQELIDTRAGKLQDVLDVERELSRVREEIERLQGQLNLLENQSALSTVSIDVQELTDYVPAETPTFPTQIRRVWDASLENVTSVLRGIVLFAVGSAPWLVFIIPGVVTLTLLSRWSKKLTGSRAHP